MWWMWCFYWTDGWSWWVTRRRLSCLYTLMPTWPVLNLNRKHPIWTRLSGHLLSSSDPPTLLSWGSMVAVSGLLCEGGKLKVGYFMIAWLFLLPTDSSPQPPFLEILLTLSEAVLGHWSTFNYPEHSNVIQHQGAQWLAFDSQSLGELREGEQGGKPGCFTVLHGKCKCWWQQHLSLLGSISREFWLCLDMYKLRQRLSNTHIALKKTLGNETWR